MKYIRILPLIVVATLTFADEAFSWSTGIGIIDNNVPGVVRDPATILKDPVGAITDLASKSGCYRCDKLFNAAVPEQKRRIANAVITTGFVTSPLGDLGTVITVGVLVAASANKPIEGRDVPINTSTPTATGIVYDEIVDCIVQRPDNRIDAYSVKKIVNIDKIRKGDTINLTAPKVCAEYDIGDVRSVTAVTILVSGSAIDPSAQDGKEFKYFLVGIAS